MPHHMVVPKARKHKDRTRKAPLPEDYKPIEEKTLIPKAGRDKESYRGSRRNLYSTITSLDVSDGEHLRIKTIRRKDPEMVNLAEYGAQYYNPHPELIKRVSERGEVSYVTAGRWEEAKNI